MKIQMTVVLIFAIFKVPVKIIEMQEWYSVEIMILGQGHKFKM